MSRGPRPSRPAVLGSASWRSAAVVLLGLLVIGGLAVIDSRARPGSIVIGTVVLAPFLVSALAGPRATALVAAVAFIVSVVSGAWNHNFDTGAYYLRAAVMLAGGAVSVLAATANDARPQPVCPLGRPGQYRRRPAYVGADR